MNSTDVDVSSCKNLGEPSIEPAEHLLVPYPCVYDPGPILVIIFVTDVARGAALRPRVFLQSHGDMQNFLVHARHVRQTHEVVWLITSQRKGGRAMIQDGRYVTVEDAARQLKVTPITFRQWLAVGTMPQFQFEGTGYVLRSDVDAFDESCQCRNQRWTYEPKRLTAVAF